MPAVIRSLTRSRVLLLGAALCIAARLGWELLYPLHFSTVKSVLYRRDAITLFPASILGVLAIAKRPAPAPAPAPAPQAPAPATQKHWLQQRWFVPGVALVVTIACYAIARFALLGLPHVVDEAAYLYQAGLFAHGNLSGHSLPFGHQLLIEYVGDWHGHRLTAFFPGSAVPLAIGKLLGGITLVDPILAGLLVLMTYWAGRRLLEDTVAAAVGAVLFGLSPFLLFQGASYFGQVWTALLLLPAIVWALRPVGWWSGLLVGACCGAAVFSRPVSVLAAAIVVLAVWSATAVRTRHWAALGAELSKAIVGGLPFLGAFLALNHHLTGRWLLTAHRLLLPDERIQGLSTVLRNIGLNMAGLSVDLTGLMVVGLAMVGVGVAAKGPGRNASVAVVAFAGLQLALYSLYYNNGISYGPRYVFEAAPLLALVAARGLRRGPHNVSLHNGHILALAAALTLMGALPGRIAVFHQRAQYLDLTPVAGWVAHERPFGGAVVLVTHGPYDFPDSFQPGFVANGSMPKGKIIWIRDDPLTRCEVRAAYPDRTLFILDMNKKAVSPHGPGALRPLAMC